jgi:rhamnosyltransferase
VSKTDVSIVILARNEEANLRSSLPMIKAQHTALSFEVIGLDTESEDRTADLFSLYGARVITIPRAEFHHVKARMRGLKESSGTYVVFLVGDAIPLTVHWLENLVRPLLQDPKVAASYSRQLPRDGCVPWEARDIYAGGSPVRKIKAVDFSDPYQVMNYRRHIWEFITFSDVSSCYRRELLERYPFNPALPEVEDQEWCKRAIDLGYAVVFEPASAVVHSHNDSLKRLYGRTFIYGQAFALFLDEPPDSLARIFYRAIHDAVMDWFYIVPLKAPLARKLLWICEAPVVRLIKRWAFSRGMREKSPEKADA